MTPLALACAAILAIHAVAYYVFIATNCPVWIKGHEPLGELEGDR